MAGTAAKTTFMVAIRQRPASWERTSRSTRSAEVCSKRRASVGAAPRVLVSWMPLIDRPSSTCTCRSASLAWRAAVTAYRIRATWRVRMTAGGSTTRVTRASCQLSSSIATRVPTTVVRLDGDRGGRRGDDRLHAADVVDDPRLDLAAAGAGEEADRLALQVAEEVGAQAVHHALADGGRLPGLDDADRGGRDGDADHEQDAGEQQGDVLLGDRDVDDALDQERLGQRDQRAGDDQGDHEGQAGAVRREEAADAAQGDGGVGELGLVGLRGTRGCWIAGAASAAAAHGLLPCAHLSQGGGQVIC